MPVFITCDGMERMKTVVQWRRGCTTVACPSRLRRDGEACSPDGWSGTANRQHPPDQATGTSEVADRKQRKLRMRCEE